MLQSLVTAWRDQGAFCPAHCRDLRVKPVTLPGLWPSCSQPPARDLVIGAEWTKGRKWWPPLSSPLWARCSHAQLRKDSKQSFGHFISTVINTRYVQVFANVEITVWTLVCLSVFISNFLDSGRPDCSYGWTILPTFLLLPISSSSLLMFSMSIKPKHTRYSAVK